MLLNFDLIACYENSFRENFSLPALTDYDSDQATLSYGDFAKNIARLHLFFEALGLRPGDKIALVGKNSAEWTTVFMATISYGAVIVPILHEFSPDDIISITNHSEASLMFVGDSIAKSLDFSAMPAVKALISLDSRLHVLAEKIDAPLVSSLAEKLDSALDAKLGGREFAPADISYRRLPNDHTAIINYTSGTSGHSKGVILTIGNLAGNVKFGVDSKLHFKASRCLSFLPLAHAYGCAFDMLVPLATGTHITFLGRTPSPRTLIKAFAEVRPNLVLCVPLILEKIYKHMIVPALNKKSVRALLMIPGVDRLIYRQVRHKLTKAFGGQFEQVIVGGAPMNSEVEIFLKKIGFHFTVGYGMTECAPLISYTHWKHYQLFSSGAILPGIMEVKILEDQAHQSDGHATGEILVRGVNVMKGYYKRPDLTELAITEDGWLHTGDMGYLGDDQRTIFIRGRYKTMILGPSGQNIYPETIEDRLNAHSHIIESIVIEREGKLTALILPDVDALAAEGIGEDAHAATIEATVKKINATLAPFERIHNIELVKEPFEKTPKKSIKRFLYS